MIIIDNKVMMIFYCDDIYLHKVDFMFDPFNCNCWCMIKTSSDLPQKSSAILDSLQKLGFTSV